MVSGVDDSDLPWGVQLRRWRTEVKIWSQQELVDQVVRLAFETNEDRGTSLDVRLVGKWENGSVGRPQSMYRRLLSGLGAPTPKDLGASGRSLPMRATPPTGDSDDTGNVAGRTLTVLDEQQRPPALSDRETTDSGVSAEADRLLQPFVQPDAETGHNGHPEHGIELDPLPQVDAQPCHTSMGADAPAVGKEDNVKRRRLLQSLAALGATTAVSPAGIALETIRTSVSDAFMASDRDVEYWEERVVEYGYTYRLTPLQELKAELAADLVDVRLIVDEMNTHAGVYQCPPEWCRVAGALAGLMAKTLGNLGHTDEARHWWRTAQAASDTSGDIEARLWVRGERAIHGLYEQRPLHFLLRQASDAIDLAQDHPCSGLAHASTARAQALAVAGDVKACRAELARTEDVLNRLPSHVSNDPGSEHGWGEDRLRYTETWVHAYNGDEARTDAAAEQAKALYPAENHRTPVQIELMQAFVRTRSGDVTEGIRHAYATFEQVPAAHRTNMIVELAQRVLQPVASDARKRADVTAYRELLALPAPQTEIKL